MSFAAHFQTQRGGENRFYAAVYSPSLNIPDTGVIVTGGASGIGLASAHAVAAVGRPVALWDIDHRGVLAAAKTLRNSYGVACIGLHVDLRDPHAIKPAVARSREDLGSIGGLVHSAGTVEVTGIEGVTPEKWDAGIHLHTLPLVLLVQAILPDLKEHPHSAVVAVASINATLGAGTIPIYTAAKAGVLGLVRSMADELARDAVRINAISPGVIDTPMLSSALDANARQHFQRRILLGRLGRAEEIGRVVRFLLSSEASYMTGAEIVVDGGNITSQR